MSQEKKPIIPIVGGRAKVDATGTFDLYTEPQALYSEGLRLLEEGDFLGAKSIFHQAIHKYETVFGLKHEKTLRIIYNVGNFHRRHSELEKAEELYLRVMPDMEEVLGPDFRTTIKVVDGLAVVYSMQGRVADAERHFLRSLQAKERTAGPEHKETINTVANLAKLYDENGRLQEAQKMYRRALRGYREWFGPEHSETLTTARDFALLSQKLGNYPESERLLKQVLRGYRMTLGPEHLTTLHTIEELAHINDARGRPVEAEDMYKKVLEGYKKTLDPQHIDNLRISRLMGAFYRRRGNLDRAGELLQESLESHRKFLGEEHGSTVSTLTELGLLYEAQGRIDEAGDMLHQALREMERIRGPDHESTLDVVSELGNVYKDQGKFAEAEEMLNRAMDGYRKLNSLHKRTLFLVASRIADLAARQGRIMEAEKMYQQILQEHPKGAASNEAPFLARIGSKSQGSEMTKLCRFCKQINFAAILTPTGPLDNDKDKNWGPLYQSGYAGNGKAPDSEYYAGKTRRTAPFESYLPQIRTAHYDQLSESSEEGNVLNEDLSIADEDDWNDEMDTSTEFSQSLPDSAESNQIVPGSAEELIDGSSNHGSDADDDLDTGGEDDADGDLGTEDEGDAEDATDNSSESKRPTYTPMERVQDLANAPQRIFDEMLRNINIMQAGEGWDSGKRPHRRSRFDAGSSSNTNSDEGDVSSSSASTWSGHSHFTENTRIDLDKQSNGNWNYRWTHFYYLGSIWDVRSRRRECDICRYFWSRIRTDRIVKKVFLTKSRCVLKCLEYICESQTGVEEKNISMLNLAGVYGYKVRHPGPRTWNISVPFVLHGAHRNSGAFNTVAAHGPEHEFKDEWFGQARLQFKLCNSGLFRKWLHLCESKHKHPTKVPADPGMARKMHLVDVKDRCIVSWEGVMAGLPRYVALSYMRGPKPQRLMLRRENYTRLKEKAALRCLKPDQTIQDAIDLVDMMGERYLWVDALCIIQDDKQDKKTQIPQMHLIYGYAILTIVAASSESAGEGLPGMYMQQRTGTQAGFECENMTVLSRGYTSVLCLHEGIGLGENYLREARYCTRGWTFQEGLLSTRALVFTRQQVYWECATCTWSEDTHWESESLAYLGQRAIIDPVPDDVWADNFDRDAYAGFKPTRMKSRPNSYAHLVKSYTHRQLTHESDILNAFMGVTKWLEARDSTRFFLGLREQHFGNDLLWGWNSPHIPREGLPFPSWSWAAWKGAIDIPNEPRHNGWDPTDDMEPSDGVRCHVLEANDTGHALRAVNPEGGWRFYEGYAKLRGGHFDASIQFRPREPSTDGEGSCEGNSSSEGDRSDEEESRSTISRSQQVTLEDLKALSCFPHLQPGFHIFFWTWSCPVVLSTQGNNRQIYVTKNGKKGVFFGTLMFRFNPLGETDKDIPDGYYEALCMNNNQGPELGHMLVQQRDGIAYRICMAMGPAKIQQIKYCATWRLIVMG